MGTYFDCGGVVGGFDLTIYNSCREKVFTQYESFDGVIFLCGGGTPSGGMNLVA